MQKCMEKQDLQIQVMIVKELSTSLKIEIIPEKKNTHTCVRRFCWKARRFSKYGEIRNAPGIAHFKAI